MGGAPSYTGGHGSSSRAPCQATILLAGYDGTIQRANQNARDLFQAPIEYVLESSLYDLFPSLERPTGEDPQEGLPLEALDAPPALHKARLQDGGTITVRLCLGQLTGFSTDRVLAKARPYREKRTNGTDSPTSTNGHPPSQGQDPRDRDPSSTRNPSSESEGSVDLQGLLRSILGGSGPVKSARLSGRLGPVHVDVDDLERALAFLLLHCLTRDDDAPSIHVAGSRVGDVQHLAIITDHGWDGDPYAASPQGMLNRCAQIIQEQPGAFGVHPPDRSRLPRGKSRPIPPGEGTMYLISLPATPQAREASSW